MGVGRFKTAKLQKIVYTSSNTTILSKKMTEGKLKGHHGGVITFAVILDENGCSAVSLPKHDSVFSVLV